MKKIFGSVITIVIAFFMIMIMSFTVVSCSAEEINNSKIIDEKIEDLFIIKEVIIDNNISYEWEKILE